MKCMSTPYSSGWLWKPALSFHIHVVLCQFPLRDARLTVASNPFCLPQYRHIPREAHTLPIQPLTRSRFDMDPYTVIKQGMQYILMWYLCCALLYIAATHMSSEGHRNSYSLRANCHKEHKSTNRSMFAFTSKAYQTCNLVKNCTGFMRTVHCNPQMCMGPHCLSVGRCGPCLKSAKWNDALMYNSGQG